MVIISQYTQISDYYVVQLKLICQLQEGEKKKNRWKDIQDGEKSINKI